MHIRFFHLDIINPCRRIERNVEHLCAFANHLLVHLALWRHVNDDIALNGRLAAKAAAVNQAAFLFVAVFNRIPFRQRVVGNGDPMFGKFSISRCDLAFGTNAATSANRVEIHAQLPGCGEDRCAGFETSTFARRGEQHQMLLCHGEPLKKKLRSIYCASAKGKGRERLKMVIPRQIGLKQAPGFANCLIKPEAHVP